MRFKYETRDERIKRLSKWRRVFAWFPIWDKGTCYWLEFIEIRQELFIKQNCYTSDIFLTEYRRIK